jgi:hypothetical protein
MIVRLSYAEFNMRSLCLLLVLGLVPLGAQTSLDDSARVAPASPPASADVNTVPGPTSASISTNIALPAAPVVQAKLARFMVSPGTVREGFTYREGAKAVVTLTAPATKPLVCIVISSDPKKLACGGITFQKGEQEQKGILEIEWKNIDSDCQIAIKVYDPAHPETILHSRIYLRKNPIKAN